MSFTTFLNSTHATHVIPSGAACFANSLQAGNLMQANCTITNDMLQFLNLTDGFKYYFNAYCLNPPLHDGCPYGYCPNSDIAGLFVRISAYLTNFFVALLVFYDPESLKESFWSQVLSVYSLLLTCAWTILRHHLTRIHAILTLATAGSPLAGYILVYAVRSWWKGKHRLSNVVGPGKILPRVIALTAFALWVALIAYVLLPSHLSDFQQESCEENNNVVKYFFFLPVLIFVDMPLYSQVIAASPFPLLAIAWLVAVILRRRQIWPKGTRFNFHAKTAWRVVKTQYPFIHFISIVVIPTAYWIATIEVGVLAAKTNDNHLSASFGQVLAMFVAVPPIISAIKLTPRLSNWFTDLAWVRFITFRPQRDPEAQDGIHVVFPWKLKEDDTEMDEEYPKDIKPYFPNDSP